MWIDASKLCSSSFTRKVSFQIRFVHFSYSLKANIQAYINLVLEFQAMRQLSGPPLRELFVESVQEKAALLEAAKATPTIELGPVEVQWLQVRSGRRIAIIQECILRCHRRQRFE